MSAGNTVTLTPGDYGWEIDQSGTESNLMQAINDGTQGDFEIVYTSTALSRNENDIGNSYVELSLSDQHFWLSFLFAQFFSLVLQTRSTVCHRCYQPDH